MVLALVLFLATYAALLVFSNYRAWIALASAALFLVLGILPFSKVFGAVDWNVIMMIAGTMGTVHYFIQSKMPALMADHIIDRMPNIKWIIIALSLFAGIISAFVDNVATVLMLAPVALVVSRKLDISPVPALISIAVSSNLQGAATLVGDTTSILLSKQTGMNFADFFWYEGRPGLFFIVQAGAILSGLILMVIFRKYKHKISLHEKTAVHDHFPTVMLMGTIVLLILASFVPEERKPGITNGLICVGVMLVGLLREMVRSGRPLQAVKSILREVDHLTLLLLAGLFVIIAGISEAGVVDEIGRTFASVSGGNVFVAYTLIVWASVLLSAFIDNIPYVATMLPVTAVIASHLGVNPTVLYFGLLVGATLGGNLTPIGASANITGIGILRKNGCEVKNRDFMRISIPFTLTAVTTGYLLVWLSWGLGL
ncbi:MAG: SLC13 family permease [Eubacteriales bacterium]|nr:SLC13 family permease [Eubacteriales bacterium]MDD3572137.1 SLC13 family permease [Eubacteriales bacterium]MDD4134044.1 SLC13 family permease [Eubacteriales bacterium]